jgi:hypothetical protein
MMGNVPFRIMTILGIIAGIGMTIRWAYEERQAAEILVGFQLFIRIDDLAHQQFAEMEARGNPTGFTWFDEFKEIDLRYHKATTIKEKSERIKEMIKFFDGMDEYLHNVGWLYTTGDLIRDKEYHQIRKIFDTLNKS